MVCAAEGLSAGRDHGGAVQRRAAQADALPRRQGGAHPGGRARASAWSTKAVELAETHGWFLTRQFENEANADYPLAHHRARDRRRLRGRAARLLGDRLRHRRHAEGRRARAARRSGPRPRSSSASPTTRRCSAAASSRRATPTARPPRRIPAFKPHPMQGWTPDFIPKLTARCGRDEGDRPHHADPGRRRDALQPASSRSKEGIFVGITAGATFAGALAGRRARRRRARTSSACCPTPASAI